MLGRRIKTIKSLRFPRTPQGAAGFGAGVFAVLQDLHAVDENVFHSDGVLMGFVESCAVRDCRRIEDDHVSEHSFLNETAVIKTEIRRWQRAQASHCFGQREHFFVARIFSEHAREIPVSAWMGI
jgi:hypothetical protein